MRSQGPEIKYKKAGGKVLEEVMEVFLPEGIKTFPEDFYSPAAKTGSFNEISIPSSPLRYVGHMFGKEELTSEDSGQLLMNNRFEVQFLLFCQTAGKSVARIPAAPVESTRTVNEYKKYLREVRRQLLETYFRRTLDQNQASRLTSEAWRTLNLPNLED